MLQSACYMQSLQLLNSRAVVLFISRPGWLEEIKSPAQGEKWKGFRLLCGVGKKKKKKNQRGEVLTC